MRKHPATAPADARPLFDAVLRRERRERPATVIPFSRTSAPVRYCRECGSQLGVSGTPPRTCGYCGARQPRPAPRADWTAEAVESTARPGTWLAGRVSSSAAPGDTVHVRWRHRDGAYCRRLVRCLAVSADGGLWTVEALPDDALLPPRTSASDADDDARRTPPEPPRASRARARVFRRPSSEDPPPEILLRRPSSDLDSAPASAEPRSAPDPESAAQVDDAAEHWYRAVALPARRVGRIALEREDAEKGIGRTAAEAVLAAHGWSRGKAWRPPGADDDDE